jgi:hypothetical protein
LICIPSFSPSAFTILISYYKQTERYTELELTAHSGGPHFYVTSESKENNLCSKNFNEFGVQLIAKSILVWSLTYCLVLRFSKCYMTAPQNRAAMTSKRVHL